VTKTIKIAEIKDLLPGKAAGFDVEGLRIAVFNVDGAYYAIDDTCPHSGGPLCEGDVRDFKVTCPWHGADFDLKTGAVLCAPAFEDVRSYKVVVEGSELKVEIDEITE